MQPFFCKTKHRPAYLLPHDSIMLNRTEGAGRCFRIHSIQAPRRETYLWCRWLVVGRFVGATCRAFNLGAERFEDGLPLATRFMAIADSPDLFF